MELKRCSYPIEEETNSIQELTDITNLKAVKEELPAPDDITIDCHYCDAEFNLKNSHNVHMKSFHDAEESDLGISEKRRSNTKNPTIVKREDKNKELTDIRDLKTVKEELPDPVVSSLKMIETSLADKVDPPPIAHNLAIPPKETPQTKLQVTARKEVKEKQLNCEQCGELFS